MLSLSSRSKALLLTLGIFVLGLVCGATAERWILLGPWRVEEFRFKGPPFRGSRFGGPPPERLLNRFTRHLDLTREQEQEIRRFLEESRESTWKVQEKVREEMQGIKQTTQSKILGILTPEQQEKYEKAIEKYEKAIQRKKGQRMRPPRRRRPGGPGRPPPF